MTDSLLCGIRRNKSTPKTLLLLDYCADSSESTESSHFSLRRALSGSQVDLSEWKPTGRGGGGGGESALQFKEPVSVY